MTDLHGTQFGFGLGASLGLGACKTGEGVSSICSSYQSRLPKVILCFEIFDFGAVRAIDYSYRDREDSISLMAR